MSGGNAAGGGENVGVGEGGVIPEIYLDYMKQVLTPYLVAEKCFERFFVNFDFFDGKCLSEFESGNKVLTLFWDLKFGFNELW